MLIGHFGVAFAAKRLTPRTSLATLVLAAEFLDFLWPIFLMVGLEHVRVAPGITRVTPLDFYDYPISHSLATALGWAAVFSLGYFTVRRNKRGAWVLAVLVLSHWFLDVLVHRPDLPLWPHGPLVGLGIWNSVTTTVVVEGGMFVVGVLVYVTTTSGNGALGRYAFWALVVLLAAIWSNSLRGQPPPSTQAVEWAAFSLWITVLWTWWADRQREGRLQEVSVKRV